MRGMVARGVDALLERHGLARASVKAIATVDKKSDEVALLALAGDARLDDATPSLPAFARQRSPGIETPSETVKKFIGTRGVAEPAALLAAGAAKLVVPKQDVHGGGGRPVDDLRGRARSRSKSEARRRAMDEARKGSGVLSIVGIGPGSAPHTSPAALEAITSADVVVGYITYIKLVRHLTGGEGDHPDGDDGGDRARARGGRAGARWRAKVAIISSGDARGCTGWRDSSSRSLQEIGLEAGRLPRASDRARNDGAQLVRVFGGGAPAMRLPARSPSPTSSLPPWPVIEKRLEAAAAADFVIELYNPASGRRTKQIVTSRTTSSRATARDDPRGAREERIPQARGEDPHGPRSLHSTSRSGCSRPCWSAPPTRSSSRAHGHAARLHEQIHHRTARPTMARRPGALAGLSPTRLPTPARRSDGRRR